jgi:HK97 family phage major capsid protein
MVSAAAGVGWLDNLRDKMPMQLLGLPVCISEKLPALGTAKDVLLVDFQHYLIGDRQQVEVAYSEHFKFTNNQGTWRFVHRVDGQPWLRGSITLSDATSTVSPYVFLT